MEIIETIVDIIKYQLSGEDLPPILQGSEKRKFNILYNFEEGKHVFGVDLSVFLFDHLKKSTLDIETKAQIFFTSDSLLNVKGLYALYLIGVSKSMEKINQKSVTLDLTKLLTWPPTPYEIVEPALKNIISSAG